MADQARGIKGFGAAALLAAITAVAISSKTAKAEELPQAEQEELYEEPPQDSEEPDSQEIDKMSEPNNVYQGFPNNVAKIRTVRVTCTLAGRAYQLPDFPVVNGMQLIIKAWPLNANLIYVGEDLIASTNVDRIYPLAASESVSYQVNNADTIYISSLIPGESVSLTTEKVGG